MSDPINHPEHYTIGGIEVIDALEAWGLPFHLANVIKYLVRAGRKDPAKLLEDLEKARWYLDRYIALVKRQRAEKPTPGDASNAGRPTSSEWWIRTPEGK